jgi:hypothetical protein
VGQKECVTATDISAWNDEWNDAHWSLISPLIIINGCHTTDMTPDALATFVDALTGAYAAGVIGTETTVHENVASEAAERLLTHLCKGEKTGRGYPVGEAIRKMRFELLRKGNVMGLTYTAYCSAALTLPRIASGEMLPDRVVASVEMLPPPHASHTAMRQPKRTSAACGGRLRCVLARDQARKSSEATLGNILNEASSNKIT